MPELSWSQAVETIEPHVFGISTPLGSGTGFLISNSRSNPICGIATAAHVINHAHYWEEPIRIHHATSGESLVIRREERAVFLDENRDTATILFARGKLPVPADPLNLAPKDKFLRVGNKIGWLGFPAIPMASLCFFSGDVSAWLEDQASYLVDGVAINGVSGGPAFHILDAGEESQVLIIGVVSAYMPNRATGDILPGLSVVRDVSQFHELAPTFASLDQAREAEPKQEAQPAPPPDDEGANDTAVRRHP